MPVFTINREDFEIDDWDLTTKKIVSSIGIISLKYIFNIYFNIHNNKWNIDGFKTISMIANETIIGINVVKGIFIILVIKSFVNFNILF